MFAKVIEFTAIEESGREYTFKAYELTTGEVCVPYETTSDGWFSSVEEVDACGTDQIVAYARLEQQTNLAAITSVRQSAKEFGTDAIPESLRHWLVRDAQRHPRRW